MKDLVLSSEIITCPCCMETHEVKCVRFEDINTFKGVRVTYLMDAHYCELADEYYAENEQISLNDLRLKDAYREKIGLLTSRDIIKIRKKYGFSQSDLCEILGWGEKTITRYESHQVQDKAHDMILRKIASDPQWVIELLESKRGVISEKAINKYLNKAYSLYGQSRDIYLQKYIQAQYAQYRRETEGRGETPLPISDVSDFILKQAQSSIAAALRV